MAKFFYTWFHPLKPVSADDIVFATGCTSLDEMLGFTLFQPGDGILLTRPIYQDFQRDYGLRAQVKPIFVSAKEDEFSINRVAEFEAAIKKAASEQITIRALLVCNPHNPFGRCYEPATLIEYMKMCQRNSIHLIVDEVYALSIYGSLTGEEITPFTSVLSIDSDAYIDQNYLHILYGLSKDFAASGLRVGCLWSRNKDLIAALSGLSMFSWPSTLSDKIATAMLEDVEWFKSFVEKNRLIIREQAEFATSILREYSIPYSIGYAGFFLLMDLRSFVPGKTSDQVTWDDELNLKKRMKEHAVFFNNGQGISFETPCFFRFCFMRNKDEIKLGMERLNNMLTSIKSI
jgi:1-aminocyclopropane-1-carboxylate synthase